MAGTERLCSSLTAAGWLEGGGERPVAGGHREADTLSKQWSQAWHPGARGCGSPCSQAMPRPAGDSILGATREKCNSATSQSPHQSGRLAFQREEALGGGEPQKTIAGGLWRTLSGRASISPGHSEGSQLSQPERHLSVCVPHPFLGEGSDLQRHFQWRLPGLQH